MRTNPNISLTVVGGEFRPSAEALVGPIALGQLEHYHVGITFAGTDGFSVTHGFYHAPDRECGDREKNVRSG